MDRHRRAKVIQTFIDMRYFFPEEPTGLFMADALAPHRTFDQGNSKVFNLIKGILADVAERIRADFTCGASLTGSPREPDRVRATST